jgi:diphosphomevalonate decarboxylase
MHSAIAVASSNIAFVKYWGDQDPCLRIPVNGSLSMNLGGLETRTQVSFEPELRTDQLILDDQPIHGEALERVINLLERVRWAADLSMHAVVISTNNFPMGAGIASSASGFAALTVAASAAAGLKLSERELSRLARTGSGSACRSIPGGFVEWQAGTSDEESFAFSFAPPEHWKLVDCIAVISRSHKKIGSSLGHALSESSPLQAARVADAPRRLNICRSAICERDFASFAEIVELDSNMMHGVMMTSTPTLLYWQSATIAVMQAVQTWRQEGLATCYTIDAGPNVHVLCLEKDLTQVASLLGQVPGVEEVLIARPGGPASLVDS